MLCSSPLVSCIISALCPCLLAFCRWSRHHLAGTVTLNHGECCSDLHEVVRKNLLQLWEEIGSESSGVLATSDDMDHVSQSVCDSEMEQEMTGHLTSMKPACALEACCGDGPGMPCKPNCLYHGEHQWKSLEPGRLGYRLETGSLTLPPLCAVTHS